MHSKKNGTKNVLNILKLKNKNNMKQTAVEWLLDSLDYNQNMLGIKEIIEQAKGMEKEQKENDLIDFAQWYSGMDRDKVINAYKRYKNEENTKVN